MSAGVYEFYYPDLNVRQIKKMISHEDYLQAKELDEEARDVRLKELSAGYQWFTDKSPLHESISTGLLNCNGIFKVEVTLAA